MNVAIIGCGLIGHKRARALGPEHRVIACADTDVVRARALADTLSRCEPSDDPSSAISASSVEAVFVCTSNDALAPVALRAIECGKHVLIEKPAARSAAELRSVVAELARHPGLVAKVGYNHRFHPGLARAYAIVQNILRCIKDIILVPLDIHMDQIDEALRKKLAQRVALYLF